MSISQKNSCLCLITLGLIGWAGAVLPATITVGSNDEALDPGGVCTLRGAASAISQGIDANGCTATGTYGTDDTINFSLGAATITLANTLNNHIRIDKPLTIDGTGNDITLDGNNANRIFNVVTGCTALTVKKLTFQNGNVIAAGGLGGAIEVLATSHILTVQDSTFRNNQAYYGGAIDLSGNTTLDLIVERSTFSGNYSERRGGAIWAYDATISDSTFDGNSSDREGGAIFATSTVITNSTFVGNSAANNGGAILSIASLTATHLTLVNNTAPTGAAIYIPSGTGSLKNSLIAGDATVTTPQCAVDTSATLSGATNLEWRNGATENTCNSSAPVAATVPSLSDIVSPALANNGGPTLTLALPPGSPAIDAGDPTVGLATDQRGQPRPQGSGPDLGAFEAPPAPPPAAAIPALGVWGLLALIGFVSAAARRSRRT